MAKQNLTENFAGKICPKTSTFTIGRIDIHKGLNTEGIKDHKNRPGLPQKTQGKEKPGNNFILTPRASRLEVTLKNLFSASYNS